MRPFSQLTVLLLAVACNNPGAAPPAAAQAEAQTAPPPQPVAKPVTKPTAKPAPPPSASAAPVASAKPEKPEIPDDMLPVPGGTFTMGADDEGEQDERPAHKVTIKGFLLDKTEVTNAAYLECVQAKVCKPYREGVAAAMKYGSDREFRHPNQPVVGVSWTDAKTYCEWRGKRLPREAEWERAARGDDGREYPWGNEPPDKNKHGAFAGAKNGTTVDVGSYPDGRGPYGHFDLAGNVWEWTEDMYDPYAYKRPTASEGKPGSCDEILAALNELRRNHQQGYTGTNPIPAECEHVLRGGAFNYRPQGLRASNRVHHPGGFRILVAGFRCAKDM
ncbi:MAG: SUMF1/EgtB/PvdO family nonheme iron enzyme [Myxococcales bacterium]|nr:SUMF1/EgtB/PvdO family nonheme iron enzyme [Myxococcales bacterium]MCB9579398.1 SUMF1/EgtB/PvdO family nonheme iron enzyme [Polyangiaceae bacterium]